MLEAPRADSEALSALRENRSGSYFATHRVYDPGPGRWTTPDPAMSPYVNVFSYSKANPAGLSDPSGLQLSAQELAYKYWHSSGWATGGYNAATCTDLASAIKLAKYDLKHASMGMGSGNLAGAIEKLERLHGVKCADTYVDPIFEELERRQQPEIGPDSSSSSGGAGCNADALASPYAPAGLVGAAAVAELMKLVRQQLARMGGWAVGAASGSRLIKWGKWGGLHDGWRDSYSGSGMGSLLRL